MMIALCWAMRDVPIASTIVTRAGKPFGIIATAMETAVLKDSVAPSPACAHAKWLEEGGGEQAMVAGSGKGCSRSGRLLSAIRLEPAPFSSYA